MSDATLMDVVTGERKVRVIARDKHHVAFLAERPVRAGHVVVTTTKLVAAVADLDEVAHAALWCFVHQVSLRMRTQLPCQRVCISVIGWAVRHAHVHLIPTDEPGQVPGLDGEPLSEQVMRDLQQRLTHGAPE